MPRVTTMPLVMNETSRGYGKWTSSRAVQLTDGARDERCHRRGPVQAPNFIHVVMGHKRCARTAVFFALAVSEGRSLASRQRRRIAPTAPRGCATVSRCHARS